MISYALKHSYASPSPRAESVYQNMKGTYGVNACHLLQINSRTANTPENAITDQENLPDPWTQFLSKKPSNLSVSVIYFIFFIFFYYRASSNICWIFQWMDLGFNTIHLQNRHFKTLIPEVLYIFSVCLSVGNTFPIPEIFVMKCTEK